MIFCIALDRPDLAEESRWSSNAGRVQNREELVRELEAVQSRRPSDHWVEVIQGHDIPCGPIHDINQAFEFAEQLGLDAVQDLIRDAGSSISSVSNPISFSRTPVSYRLAPPGLGADTESVLEGVDGASTRRP